MKVVVFAQDGTKEVFNPAQYAHDQVTQVLTIDEMGSAAPIVKQPHEWDRFVVHQDGDA